MTPSDRQFRAALATPRPEIVGYQSALVIKGPDGGPEIDVDKHGRILVQFYWDRKRKPSRRVRVAQVWAGSNRGALFTPRVGDEVLITYEEGDPDRPIVIGSVYNGTNTVPMKLPDKKVKSGILTLSSTGGGGYNMLLFDDTTATRTSSSARRRTSNSRRCTTRRSKSATTGPTRSTTTSTRPSATNHTIKVGNEIHPDRRNQDRADRRRELDHDGSGHHHAQGADDQRDRRRAGQHFGAVGQDQ